LNHIILNGQSLGNGNESTQQFLLHLQFTVQNLFFRSKNLELLVAPTARNSALFTLTNLTQTTSGDLGETISTGYLDAMKAKIVGMLNNQRNNTYLFTFTVTVVAI
jgi:hypothetical protein